MPPDFRQCSLEHWDRVVAQVRAHHMPGGKGEERHGRGQRMDLQPWRTIADMLRRGQSAHFFQAIKKLQEADAFGDGPEDDARFERECFGAVNYVVFAVMRRQRDRAKAAEETSKRAGFTYDEVDCMKHGKRACADCARARGEKPQPGGAA